MGGIGSGWRGERRQTVEQCLVLSAAELARLNLLGPEMHGWGGVLSWQNRFTGEVQSTIGFEASTDVEDGQVHLFHRSVLTGDAMDYRIRVTTTPMPGGGRKWWFVCPLVTDGQPCGRRVATLYLPPGARYFGCRHCHNLTYQSSQESHCKGALSAQFGDLARAWRRPLELVGPPLPGCRRSR